MEKTLAGLVIGIFTTISLFPAGLLAQWIQTKAPTGTTIYDLVANGNMVLAATDSGVFQTKNNGANWYPADSGMESKGISKFATDGKKVYASGNAGIYCLSSNGGYWTTIDTSMVHIHAYSTWAILYDIAINGNTILASFFSYIRGGGGNRYICMSVDDGKTWIEADSGISMSTCGPGYLLSASGNKFFAANVSLYRLSNHKPPWEVISTGIPEGVDAFTSIGNDIVAGIGQNISYCAFAIGVGITGGVYRSSDTGTTWVSVNTGLPDSLQVYSFANFGLSIFAGSAKGVFFTNDRCASWNAFSTGLPARRVIGALTTTAEDLWAIVNDSTLWHRPLTEVSTARDNQQTRANNVSLNFTSSIHGTAGASITFSIPRAENVSLNLFNLKGRMVLNVVNKHFNAGRHSVECNMQQLHPGFYLVRMETRSGSAVKNIWWLR